MGGFNSTLGSKAQRRAPRLSGSLRGSIQCFAASYPCLVEDISEHGLLFVSSAPLRVGDEVKIALQISVDNRLTCVVKVRHVTDEGIGSQIIDISQTDARLLSKLIGEQYATRRMNAR